jgi:large subunit ribosomal protein L13
VWPGKNFPFSSLICLCTNMTLTKTTISAKAQDVVRNWWLIDAKDQVVGVVAEATANLLRGKNKPIFTPHNDTGDYVVIINAKDTVFTGRKEEQKEYVSVSGYIGSKKVLTPKDIRPKHPERLLEHAIKGMIPKNPLGRAMYLKLHIYNGPEHEQQAQQPKPYKL